MNLSNITFNKEIFIDTSSFSECSGITVPFEHVVNICGQWENYSALSHNTYIIPVFLYYIFKIIKRFVWNPSLTYKWKGIFGNLDETYTLYWFDEFQDMCRIFLFFRIIQVWWIMNYVLV